MDLARLMIRMSQLARRRPRRAVVRTMIVVAVVVIAVLALEWLNLWPDWAQSSRVRIRP